MIQEYKSGVIIINGKTYNRDVEVYWTGEVLDWQREEGHIIDIKDLLRALGQNPDTIIIGTGETGKAKVTQECQDFIRQKGIELIIDRTEEAAKTFNVILEASEEEEGEQEKAIGLFHLTC
jgi:hypothetical protein